MGTRRRWFGICLVGGAIAWIALHSQRLQPAREGNWAAIGGTAADTHYSALDQINRANVGGLKEAWRFDTGEAGGLETTPLVIDGVLYGITPKQRIFALDGATGAVRWTFESGVAGTQPDRGMAYWAEGKERRLLVGVMNYLYELDPVDGKPVAGFGKGGRVDLREGLRGEAAAQSVALTSPGVIYKDLIIVGGRNPETMPAPPGDIRAFDVRTGAVRWVFHTIPRPGEFGYETWPKEAYKAAGAANNWAGMAVDAALGIVFVPTGSAVPDFYGAARLGDTLFADTLLALDANTGKRLWHFQGVHHDLWDRDFPSPPILLDVVRDGKAIAAVGQATKSGFFYVFDRVTGKALFPVEERVVPGSTVPGEVSARTQPFPSGLAPFAPQNVDEAGLTTRTPEAHAWAVKRLQEIRHEGQYVPLSVERDTLVMPSFEGGAEWGGGAFDPATGVMYLNANTYGSLGRLAANGGGSAGRRMYAGQCAVCHGAQREGSPPEFPSLVGVTGRLSREQIVGTIHNGRGRMPAMPITGQALTDLLGYLGTAGEEMGGDAGMGYGLTGYRRFNDPDGYPATAAPWGTLNALDLKTGKYSWQVPLGEYPELAAKGVPTTGSENYGGPVVTAGGLVFIAATNFDHKIRAFNATTGKVLWEAVLPFAGNATPAVYAVAGREYVVIAAGGSGMNPRGKTGGVYVAFSLPVH